MIHPSHVIARIEADFEARIAEEDDPDEARTRICKWLAGVSYEEWFAVIEECEARKLFGKALELACADMANPHEDVERLINAYLRGAAADLQEGGASREQANSIEQRAHFNLAAPSAEPPAEIILRGQLERVRADKDWSIERLQERIESLKHALEAAEQVLGSLPRIARSDASKRTLKKVQVVLELKEVETR